MLEPVPADVVLAASALTPLGAVPDQDPRWEQLAVPTPWPADRALQHITDAPTRPVPATTAHRKLRTTVGAARQRPHRRARAHRAAARPGRRPRLAPQRPR